MSQTAEEIEEDVLATATLCPDGNVCLRGGECIKVDNRYIYPTEGSASEREYMCDCAPEKTDGIAFYAGYQCEYTGFDVCIYGEFASQSFCTNGGCVEKFEPTSEKDAIHKGCICNDGFTGDYCQYIAGKEPVKRKMSSTATIISFSFVGACLVSGSLFLYMKRRRKRKTKEIKETVVGISKSTIV